MTRVVFFDIDGTLLLSGGAGQRAMERALVEEFHIDVPFEGVFAAGRTDYGIVTEIFDRYGIEDTPAHRLRFHDAYLDQLPTCLHALPGRLLPGIREVLDHLTRQDDVVLSLLTGNYSLGAWTKLRHFDLDHYFEFGGFGDTHADRNLVAAEAHSAASVALGITLSGSRCCVVGDTPADIACGRSIGASVVAVATGAFGSHELAPFKPDHLLADFADVDEATRRILLF